MEPTREKHLLTALSSGDRRAAEQLVDETYEMVYASLMRLTGGNADLAADLTQETYRKAWKSLPRFQRRSQLSTWLYRIAYNTFLNHIRRPARLQPIDERQVATVEAPEPGQDEMFSRREVSERLRRAVVGLPEPLRFTISARFWGELAVEEIARLEKVTGAAIRKRLKKAMGRLRTVLGEDAA
ncbi:MAG: sigma-70 family RNA polymerase sigma factor [Acidobacteriota bacterium]